MEFETQVEALVELNERATLVPKTIGEQELKCSSQSP